MRSEYTNPQLLVSPADLSRELAHRATAPLLIDLRPAEQFAAGHLPHAVHLDLFGLSLTDTDSGAVEVVPLDHRALAGHSRRDRRSAGRALRIPVRHARRAGVLVPRILRPSARARAERRHEGMDGRWISPDDGGRGAGAVHVDGLAARADSRDVEGSARQARTRRRGRARYSQRRRVPAAPPCDRRAAVRCLARFTSSGRATSRRTARSSRRTICAPCTKRPASRRTVK